MPHSKDPASKKTVLMMARLSGVSSDSVCIVRDISPYGAAVSTTLDLQAGETAILDLGENLKITGTVLWRRDSTVGIEFFVPVSDNRLLDSTHPRDGQRVLPRFHRCADVTLTSGHAICPGELIDITPYGACIQFNRTPSFQTGEIVELAIKRFIRRNVDVRWIDGMRMGVRFEYPVQFWKLGKWIEDSMDLCGDCSKVACPAPSFKRSLARRTASQAVSFSDPAC